MVGYKWIKGKVKHFTDVENMKTTKFKEGDNSPLFINIGHKFGVGGKQSGTLNKKRYDIK